jgi:hypothetical protein
MHLHQYFDAWLFKEFARRFAYTVSLKGQCHEIFDPRLFSSITPPPSGALIHGLKSFRKNGFEFAEKLDWEIAKIGLIFALSSTYNYVRFIYVFDFAIVSL